MEKHCVSNLAQYNVTFLYFISVLQKEIDNCTTDYAEYSRVTVCANLQNLIFYIYIYTPICWNCITIPADHVGFEWPAASLEWKLSQLHGLRNCVLNKTFILSFVGANLLTPICTLLHFQLQTQIKWTIATANHFWGAWTFTHTPINNIQITYDQRG